MTTPKAKHLRPALRAVLADGLGERGLTPRRRGSGTFFGDDGWLRHPLELEFWVEIDAHRYGGLRFYCGAIVAHPQVTEQLAEFSGGALSPGEQSLREQGTNGARLSSVSGGQLTDPRGSWREWVVEDETRIGPVTGELFAVVDGPLRAWAAPRRDMPTLLAGLSGPLADDAQHHAHVRPLVLLALVHGEVELGRKLVAGYRPGNTDSPERFARFEAELADRNPAYGRVQLHDAR